MRRLIEPIWIYAVCKSLLLSPVAVKKLNGIRNQILYIDFTAAGVSAEWRRKTFPVFHYSAGYIFVSFGIIEPILVTLKIEYCLSRY